MVDICWYWFRSCWVILTRVHPQQRFVEVYSSLEWSPWISVMYKKHPWLPSTVDDRGTDKTQCIRVGLWLRAPHWSVAWRRWWPHWSRPKKMRTECMLKLWCSRSESGWIWKTFQVTLLVFIAFAHNCWSDYVRFRNRLVHAAASWGEGVPFTSQLLGLQRDPAQLGTKSNSRRGRIAWEFTGRDQKMGCFQHQQWRVDEEHNMDVWMTCMQIINLINNHQSLGGYEGPFRASITIHTVSTDSAH